MSSPALEGVLFATVWLALALFVIGEAGKLSASRERSSRGWAWTIWTAGALLLALHILVALWVRHGWSHLSAVVSVREQTRTVYGLDWGGGVWVNYLFVTVWLVESAWWFAAPRSYFTRSRAAIVLTRAFYLLVLVNAAIVFAAPSRRPAGALLTLVLLWIWRDTLSTTAARTSPASSV
jgi:hypothetical protein